MKVQILKFMTRKLMMFCIAISLSLASFSQAFIEVVTPNGGEIFKTNSTHAINWRFSGVTNVKIEYTTNFNNQYPGPNNWTILAPAVPASSGSYSWNLPSTALSAARIRISDASDPTMYDISDQDFLSYDPVLNPKNLHLISPNGGEILDTASRYFNISWIGQNVGEILFQYSIDNGTSWIPIDTLIWMGYNTTLFYAGIRCYNWLIPNKVSTQCKLRILDKTDYSIQDVTDNNFTITKAQKKIQLLSPNGYEEYKTNSQHAINWSSVGINNVKIEYTSNFNYQFPGPNTWTVIVPSYAASSGTYTWNVPTSVLSAARIRISDANDPTMYDISDQDFSSYDPVLNPKNLNITSPNGGELLDTASTYFNISLTAQNVGQILFQYTIDNGGSWIPIDTLMWMGGKFSSFYAGMRSYNWKIPNVVSNQCKLRVLDKQDNTILDESNNIFTITAASKKLHLTSPNEGSYKVNSILPVTWSALGISNLKIEYTDAFNYQYPGPSTWTVIAPSVPALSGTYNWTLPATTLNARIRISDATDPNIYDISDWDFTTYDPVTNPHHIHLISPNGGERLIGKSTYFNISWTSENLGYLKFQYSVDNGGTWLPIDTLIYGPYKYMNMIASFRSYNWPIPPVISDQCKIRILDERDYTIFDECDSKFSIISTPTVAFNADKTLVSVGDYVNFTDFSGNSPTQWQWSFPGGTPDNSTLQNPSIKYDTKGYFDVKLIVSNAYGTDTLIKKSYITIGSNGVNDLLSSVQVNLYPNPNKGNVNLEITSNKSQNIDIKIFNIFGKEILSKSSIPLMTGINTEKIRLDGFPGGVYTVVISSKEGCQVKKIVKE